MVTMKESGILLPVFSLPSRFGIGGFSKEAYLWIDELVAAGQQYWQILPLGPTGFGDSPYQPFSTYAGNPYFIDLEALISEGLLSEAECEAVDYGADAGYISYDKIYFSRFLLLKKAYERSQAKEDLAFASFKRDTKWLEDYSLYMAIKESLGGISWLEWPDALRLREEKALLKQKEALKEEIDFYSWLQYRFTCQWQALKAYANGKGIRIIGDIPIYVALDSADAWASPELFLFDQDKRPIEVAGCPPDAFSATGQLWGNPLYDWEYHKKTEYAWWINRICECSEMYDVIRIDHFRGFDEFYAIPAGDATARHGQWRPGCGASLFVKMKEKLGGIRIIAEDLGFLTDSVLKMLHATGYPGMKILQFGFDSREAGDYRPETYPENCVAYTGTHDNDTLLGWFRTLEKSDREAAKSSAGITGEADCCKKLIMLLMQTKADLVIIPIQDYLELGSEGRINTPSTLGGNWTWRLKSGEISAEVIAHIRNLCEERQKVRNK